MDEFRNHLVRIALHAVLGQEEFHGDSLIAQDFTRQPFRLRRIKDRLFHLGERIRTIQKSPRRRAVAGEIIFHDLLPVDRQIQRLSHPLVAERKTPAVHREIVRNRRVGGIHREIPGPPKLPCHHGRESAQVQDPLHLSRPHSRVPRLRRRDDADADGLRLRLLAVVTIESLQERVLIRHAIHDFKRPGPLGDAGEVAGFLIETPRAKHAAPPAGHTINQHRHRLLKVEMYRVSIIRFAPKKPRINARHQVTIEGGRLVAHVGDPIEIRHHRLCIE